MKKFLFLLTGLMFMLASCGGGEDSPNEPTPTPNPTPNEPTASITMNTNIPSGGLAFDVNGGEKSVSFTTNKDWTVTVAATTGGATWCTASPASGSQGDATVKFSLKENTDYDDRSVSVTIKAGTATKTFTINQKGADALLVTTKKYEVAQEGGEIEVEVQANIDYEMEISETAKSWISEASTRALTTHKHTFTIAANEELEKREGEIIFKSGDKVETVKVYQAGGPVLVLSKNEFNVSDAGETITIEVKSNVDFGVQLPDVDWIVDEASTRGMSSHTLKYDILPNEAYDAREAEIVFYDKNSDLKETLKIVQAQKDAIIISQKNYEVKAEGETIEVKLSANVDFDVTIPDVDWITQVTTRGLTEHTLYYSIAENTSEDSRSAEIVFTNKDSQLSEKITIVQNPKLQAGYKDGVAVLLIAGTLKDILGDEVLKISSLKIIGPINGTDIKILRMMINQAKKLSILDLSDAIFIPGGEDYFSIYGYSFNAITDQINSFMFYECDNLQSIALPKNITRMRQEPFKGCTSLTSVHISDLSSWCKISYDFYDSNPFISNNAKLYLNGVLINELNIPEDITEIKKFAFRNCSFESVNIPNNVTEIGEEAFAYTSLKSVYIPNSVTNMANAFVGSSVESITFSDGLERIGKKAFAGSSLKSLIIPKSVKIINEYAFMNCTSLESIIFPDSPVVIERSAFENCSSLKSLNIPNIETIRPNAFLNCDLKSVEVNATTIENWAFQSCTSLSSVILGNDVKSVYYEAFRNCYALTTLTINNSDTKIGADAFKQSKSLAEVYCYSIIPPGCSINAFEVEETAKLYVPSGSGTVYRNSNWGKMFNNIIEME